MAMPNIKDILKQALAKKNEQQHGAEPGSANKASTKAQGRSEVTSNKPAKKAAGRGR